MVRRGFLGLAAGAFLAACGAAPGSDPVSAVEALYQPYLAGQEPRSLKDAAPWTAEFRDILARADDAARKEDRDALDFDPIIDGQDFEITDLVVTAEQPAADGRAVVQARFKNYGEGVTVMYDLAQADGGWRIDNIRTQAWNLRELLAGAP